MGGLATRARHLPRPSKCIRQHRTLRTNGEPSVCESVERKKETSAGKLHTAQNCGAKACQLHFANEHCDVMQRFLKRIQSFRRP